MANPTNPTMAQQVHALDIRLSVLETMSQARHDALIAASQARHDTLIAAFSELRGDLSDQGKAPLERPAKPRLFGLVPGSGREIAIALTGLGAVLAGMGGVSWFGAQSGGANGAHTAVDNAVEQGAAVPIATPPTLRVLPVPQVVPVPMPMPPPEAEAETEAAPALAVHPDDPLMGTR